MMDFCHLVRARVYEQIEPMDRDDHHDSLTPKVRTLLCLLSSGFFASAPLFAQTPAQPQRGVLRRDLVGREWSQIPQSQWPGYKQPLSWWESPTKFNMRYFQPSYHKYVMIVTEIIGPDREVVRAAVDFSELGPNEEFDYDCFYRNVPPCDGRLCEGLLVGVSKKGPRVVGVRYRPLAVWRITRETLRFEKVAPREVVCVPQDYGS